MLLSQYFHNNLTIKVKWQVVTNFYQDPQLTSLFFTFNNLSPKFCCENVMSIALFLKYLFYKKKKMFQIFAHSIKKKKISRTLAYFSIDSRIKMFFPALSFFIRKKVHHYYN